MYDYDFFVIGAGSGGVRAARKAAEYGASVAIAEHDRVGGTCVIRGCIPKKLFVYASQYSEHFEECRGFGWDLDGRHSFDWPTLVGNKDKEIDRLNHLYKQTLHNHGVEIIAEQATLADAHTIRLGGHTVTAENILVATGSWPFMPDIPGIEHAITSNEAFHLTDLPERVTVVGGGYIAVEFAGIFNGLGVEVAQLYRGEQILRGFDDDLRETLAVEMRKKGVNLLVNTDVEGIEKQGNSLQLLLSDGSFHETDTVMYATGRLPRTADLGLDAIGVERRENGAIVVDEYSRTTVDNIFAVGDCTDRVNLTPVAIVEGAGVAATLFDNRPTAVSHDLVPTAVFSQPEIGTVGLTEAEARARHGNIDIYKSAFRPLKHTLSGSEERALMKLVVDGETDTVLGAHMAGPDAGEIIQGIGIALTCGATKAQFDATIAVHPSASEEFVTMASKVEDTQAKD